MSTSKKRKKRKIYTSLTLVRLVMKTTPAKFSYYTLQKPWCKSLKQKYFASRWNQLVALSLGIPTGG